MNEPRVIAAAAGGVLMNVIEATLPYAALCTVMVAADMVTAYTLSRRVAAQYGSEARKAGAGKLQSKKIGKTIVTLTKVYSLLLIASLTDMVMFPDGQATVLRFATGAVCFWQAISVLENEATCSTSSWARIARRFLIDKARRHLNM